VEFIVGGNSRRAFRAGTDRNSDTWRRLDHAPGESPKGDMERKTACAAA
jgi:hypothetical protein